jgi:serine/threonine-protein kinase
LKPANIMVDERGEPYLLDFDLARTGASLALDGDFIGSLPWAAPEQAARQQSKMDTRSDVYSLGVILYFMATGGRFPYAHLDNIAEMLMEISRAAVIPPNARMCQPRHRLESWEFRPPQVPINSEIEWVVLKALGRRRDDRFRTAGEMGDAIKKYLRMEPVRPPGPVTSAGIGSWASREEEDARPSVAVLPFANMSRDADDEYFADGLAEEIINAITRVSGLKVIARTSAFAFKGKNQDVRQIAQTLGVANVVEGSVRRSGNRLRIMVQLVRASDGTHLWSERYDREINDIFAIQDEISGEVTRQLKVSLRPRGTSARRTPDVAAYEALLQARHHWHHFSSGRWVKARECFEKALSIDSQYAAAHAGLASYYGALAWAGIDDPRQTLPRARAAAEKALSLDDTLAEAHAILGVVSGVGEYDWGTAERHFRRALELDRAATEVCVPYAIWYLRPLGRLDEALAELENLRQRDPLSVMARTELAHVLFLMRRWQESGLMARQALELDPSHTFASFQLVREAISMKKFDEAVVLAERAAQSDRRWFVSLAHLAAAYSYADRMGDARRVLGEMHDLGAEKGYLHATPFATTYAAVKEIDTSVLWVERAIEQREPIITTIKTWPVFDSIRQHPRYEALLRRMNLA